MDDEHAEHEFFESAENDMAPKMKDSAFVLQLFPKNGEPDAKFCVELGYSVMYDKPIVLVIAPGQKVPDKLRMIADHLIEFDPTDKSSVNELAAAIADIGKRFQ